MLLCPSQVPWLKTTLILGGGQNNEENTQMCCSVSQIRFCRYFCPGLELVAIMTAKAILYPKFENAQKLKIKVTIIKNENEMHMYGKANTCSLPCWYSNWTTCIFYKALFRG